MANPNTVNEPSMEEILASIRQIISEDGGSAAPKIDGVIAAPAHSTRSAPAERETHHEPGEDRSAAEAAEDELASEDVADEPVATAPAEAFATYAPEEEPASQAEAERETDPQPHYRDYGAFMRSASESTETRGIAKSEPARSPRPSRAPLIAAPQAPVAGNEESALLSPASGEAVSGAFGALAHTLLAQNARTLEDVVTEMLQPMLKQWLDENLPSIVERKVREEIERVSRGRR